MTDLTARQVAGRITWYLGARWRPCLDADEAVTMRGPKDLTLSVDLTTRHIIVRAVYTSEMRLLDPKDLKVQVPRTDQADHIASKIKRKILPELRAEIARLAPAVDHRRALDRKAADLLSEWAYNVPGAKQIDCGLVLDAAISVTGLGGELVYDPETDQFTHITLDHVPLDLARKLAFTIRMWALHKYGTVAWEVD